jgi:hypothetical protein
MTAREDASGGSYSTFTYGTSSGSHNVTRPTEAKSCTASGRSTVVSDRTFTFDSYGRPSASSLSVSGSSQGTYTTTYDSDHRIDTVTYPSGFVAQYSYTSLGFVDGLPTHDITGLDAREFAVCSHNEDAAFESSRVSERLHWGI